MKEQLDIAKSFFELCKQLLIAFVLLLLIVYPAAVGVALDKMGVTEGDLWGLKWKKEFKKTDDALQLSQADKDRLADQLRLTNQAVEKQGALITALQQGAPVSHPDDQAAGIVEAAKKLVDQNQSTLKSARENTQMVQQTIATNSQLIARAQDDAQPASRWLILTGSDPTEAAALDEVQRARSAGLDGVKLIHNRGVYRTAIVYGDRQTAAAALGNVKLKTRDDAYIVSMEKWCPNARDVRPDLIECGGA